MFSIAVCDDEPEIAKQISNIVNKLVPKSIIKKYASGEELLNDHNVFDIVLLDIQIDKTNGIEAAKELRKNNKNVIIIFVTAIKEYVFDAFDVAAFHYILKPIKEEKLREVLKKAVAEIEGRKETRKLFIEKKGKSITINVDDILYLEKENHKVIVHTKTDTFSFYGVMSELEEKVGTDFVRCHRGFLVNMTYIAEYDNGNIYMANGDIVYLSRDKYQDFVKRYMRFLRDGGVSLA